MSRRLQIPGYVDINNRRRKEETPLPPRRTPRASPGRTLRRAERRLWRRSWCSYATMTSQYAAVALNGRDAGGGGVRWSASSAPLQMAKRLCGQPVEFKRLSWTRPSSLLDPSRPLAQHIYTHSFARTGQHRISVWPSHKQRITEGRSMQLADWPPDVANKIISGRGGRNQAISCLRTRRKSTDAPRTRPPACLP